MRLHGAKLHAARPCASTNHVHQVNHVKLPPEGIAIVPYERGLRIVSKIPIVTPHRHFDLSVRWCWSSYTPYLVGSLATSRYRGYRKALRVLLALYGHVNVHLSLLIDVVL